MTIMEINNPTKLIRLFKPKFELLLLAALLSCQTARAAVGFTITPAAVSNTYSGTITLLVTNLTPGETVLVQKYLDANTNGIVDAGDILVQQFNLTDGSNIVIGGVTNINVPGDTDTVAGQITAKLSFQADVMQTIVGQYLYVLSSPTGLITPPITNSFTVTNYPYAQKFTGTVVSNGVAVPNAGVLLGQPSSGSSSLNTVGGAVANNSGVYTIQAPTGTYALAAFKSNFVASTTAAANLVLSNGATINTNLTLIAVTESISGSIVDTNNTTNGLPGIFVSVQSTNNLLALFSTESNGNFTVPVNSNQWKFGSDNAALAFHGYVGLANKVQKNTTLGNVSNVTIALPKATGLFYGTVLDNSGNPLPDVVEIYAGDQTNTYRSDGYTGTNGYYVTAALGLGGNDPWQMEVDNAGSFPNYIFSQPDFDTNGGASLNVGQAIQVNFTAIPATNQITGYLLDNNSNAIPNVGISASATISNVNYQTQSADTGTNGYYSLNVSSGDWSVNVNCGCSECTGNNSLGTNYLCPNSDNVTISNNNQVADFTAILATNYITGYLLDNNGNPIAGVGINANSTNNQMQSSATGTNGYYSLNVGSGNWTVNVNCPCSGCTGNDFLPTNYLCPNSDNVTVSNNNPVANFTAILAANYISGSLTNNNGSAITNVGIYANTTISNIGYSQNAVTGTNGHYSINVANGTWMVGVDTCCDCGNIASLPCNYVCSTNQTVVISNNNGTADFTAIPATNSISGSLTNTSGNPIPNVGIYANTTVSNIGYSQNAVTGTNGNYSMNVANASWSVGVNSCSNCNNSLPGIYLVPQNQTVVISNDSGAAYFTAQYSSSSPLQVTTTSPLSNATQNAFYSTTLTASGGQPPYTWGLAPGSASLPSGLSLAANGVISGTPIGSGTAQFIVLVTDATNAWNYQFLSLTVNASTLPQRVILTIPGQPGTGEFEFCFKIASDVTYTVQSSTNLKTWAVYETFNFSNSVPTSGGYWTVTIPNATNASRCFYRVMVGQ